MTFGKSDHGKLGHGWGGAVEQAGDGRSSGASIRHSHMRKEEPGIRLVCHQRQRWKPTHLRDK